MNKFKKIRVYVLLSIAMVAFMKIHAQPTGDPTGDPDATPVEEVPIDGGLSLLLGAGIVYGAKRAYDSKKKDKNAE
jgi:hypothetical protein